MIQTQQELERLKTLQESYDDLSEGVSAIADKIDNIKLPEIDTTELAKESTLNAVSNKLDNLNVEVDLSSISKQGSNADATNSAILEGIERLLARSAKYDTTTGNLQFDNIDLTIV